MEEGIRNKSRIETRRKGKKPEQDGGQERKQSGETRPEQLSGLVRPASSLDDTKTRKMGDKSESSLGKPGQNSSRA